MIAQLGITTKRNRRTIRVLNENRLIKPLNDQYFLAPPEAFITHHLPEIPVWELLSDPI